MIVVKDPLSLVWAQASGDRIALEHADGCDTTPDSGCVKECLACGWRDCPHDEPLHYHHDGCPVCAGGVPVETNG